MNKLKQWRQARAPMTQEQLAEALGISPRHVQRLESGASPLTPTLERLLAIL